VHLKRHRCRNNLLVSHPHSKGGEERGPSPAKFCSLRKTLHPEEKARRPHLSVAGDPNCTSSKRGKRTHDQAKNPPRATTRTELRKKEKKNHPRSTRPEGRRKAHLPQLKKRKGVAKKSGRAIRVTDQSHGGKEGRTPSSPSTPKKTYSGKKRRRKNSSHVRNRTILKWKKKKERSPHPFPPKGIRKKKSCAESDVVGRKKQNRPPNIGKTSSHCEEER